MGNSVMRRLERRRCSGTFNRLCCGRLLVLPSVDEASMHWWAWLGRLALFLCSSIRAAIYMVHCMHIRRGHSGAIWSSLSLSQPSAGHLSLHFVAHFIWWTNIAVWTTQTWEERNGPAYNDQCVRQKGYFSLNLRVDKAKFCPTHFGAS